MATDSSLLDEAICDMPVCQHPLCWASMRRLGRGRPRYMDRKPGSSFGSTSEDEDELPTMKIVTLPSFQPLPANGADRSSSSLRCCTTRMELEHLYCSFAYERAMRSFSNKTSKCSLEKLHFPGLNSMRDLETSHKNPRRISQGKVQKLDVIGLDASAPSSHSDSPKDAQPSVVWVPNTKQKCQRQRQQEGNRIQTTLRIGIKDLTSEILSSSSDFNNRSTVFRMKRKKSNKVPTGGQPYNQSMAILHAPSPYSRRLLGNLPTMSIKGKKKHSFSTEPGIPEALPLQRRSYSSRQPCVTAPELKDQSSPLLGNRKVVLHQTKERHSHTGHLQNEAPCYKLDEKPAGAVKGTEIDLISIKNQHYLWKKYIDRVGPNGKIEVPGYRPKQGQQLDKSFGLLEGLGLFPSPVGTSRPRQKKHVEQIGGSMTSKEESSNDSRAVSSHLATVSGGSSPVQIVETTPTFNKQLSPNTDTPSEFTEEENPREHLTGPEGGQDSVKPEAVFSLDVNGGGGTEPLEGITGTQYAVSGEDRKVHQREEHPGTSPDQSDHLLEAEQGDQLNDFRVEAEGETESSSHPPPPPPSPVPLNEERTLGEENPAEVEPAITSP